MWARLTRFFPVTDTRLASGSKFAKRTATPVCRKPALRLETLEQREVPAISIVFDYSYDVTGFFSDPGRRAVLQQAANDIAGHLSANLSAITPSGGNTYSWSFFNPADGQFISVPNRSLPANTIVVYAGGRYLNGMEAGIGGYGGYSASGSQQWMNTLQARGPGGVMLWGGSLTFDVDTNWYTSTSTSGINGSQVDFYTVASHELGHLLGIGTSPSWFNQSSGGYFHGATSKSVYGGPVPLYGDSSHWADGITAHGTAASLDPIVTLGGRTGFSPLDFAALSDIGWTISTSPTSPPAPPPVTLVPIGNGTPVIIYTPQNSSGTGHPVLLTGPADGSAQAFGLNNNGQLVAAGPRVVPFPGFTGVIRTAVADFNNDGADDFAFGTGAGTDARVRIIDGKTGGDLAGPTSVLDGFGGGVYLAAADVDRDGKAELAVSADAGGGNRISIFKVNGSGLQRVSDFIAFGDANFRGGSRIALGDVNHDGAADLIVGAGIGGGPRIAIYNGTSLTAGRPTQLLPDFFALDPNLRSGVSVTTSDLDGDGYSDLIYSMGTGGGPRVRVLSGAVLTVNPGRDGYFLPALADFFALDPNDRNGLRLAARDLNNDGKAELLVAGGNGTFTPVLRMFNYPNYSVATQSFDPFNDPFLVDGLYVG